ncbi:MAG: hypothetical protein A2Z08_06980 [Deltaproteobacteria bacterium RBG_16_54_11]|nr:MAG: hypothetical protein A2Z08_06980 [Deltaproteobacteria bacterium RBG_16_54_11]
MKKLGLLLIFLITLVAACGYGMYYTKSIHPVPSMITAVNVMPGDAGSGKNEFVTNIFINELLQTKRFKITNDTEYVLYLKIDEYKAGYRKYIALSSKIVNTKTNEIVWNSSISGLSKSYIDKVIKNTVKELVMEMTK